MPLTLSSFFEEEVRIDCLPFPPLLVGVQLEHREMQMRRIRRRVACRADVADHVALRDRQAFLHAVGIPLQVRVVITEAPGRIELVDRESARPAVKELGDLAVFDGMHRRVARSQDVDRLVRPIAAARLGEAALECLDRFTVDRHAETAARDVAGRRRR